MAELLAKASMAKAAASKVAVATGLHANVGMATHPSIDYHATPSGGHCGTGTVQFHPTEHTHVGVTGSGCIVPDGHGGTTVTGPGGVGKPIIDFSGGFDF